MHHKQACKSMLLHIDVMHPREKSLQQTDNPFKQVTHCSDSHYPGDIQQQEPTPLFEFFARHVSMIALVFPDLACEDPVAHDRVGDYQRHKDQKPRQ